MTRQALVRKKRFVAALALAETTAELWAKEQGVHPGHLSHVLSGNRPSPPLEGKIDAFSRKILSRVKEVA